MSSIPFASRICIATLLLSSVIAFPAIAFGQAEDAKAWHQPQAMPDRIMLGWTSDPTTSMSVNWRTSLAVMGSRAEIAVAGDGPDFSKLATAVEAQSQKLVTEINEAAFHTAHFTGLKPDTIYAYRVGDGKNWSEWNQFRTASAKPDPFAFIYVGDAQANIYSYWSRVIRQAYSSAPDVRFILHAGDLVNRHNRDDQWGEWFHGAGWINSKVALFPVPGNHEYGNGPAGNREISPHWRPQFVLPENGPPGLEETCYYTDIQGVRVIGLNSNMMREEQAEWLERLLASNPNRWTILTFHHPVYSSSHGRDNKELRELWKPVFDKYKVDLVLTGHDHTYARSNLVSGVNMVANSGTVYVVSVSGPKMYKVDRESWMARSASRTQLYQVIRIGGDKLTYEARTATGSLYDAFELTKRPGKPNKLTNKIPRTPENLN